MSWFVRVLVFGLLATALCLGILAAILGDGMQHVVFAKPGWLALILAPVLAVVLRVWLAPRPATMRFTRKRSLDRVHGGFAVHLVDLPDGLRLAAVILLVLACARPQSTRMSERVSHEGIDIVIALDLSESMEIDDLRPNRLGAAKLVIDDFISRRRGDRIGLVAFGSRASTVAPLTLDHSVLRNLVAQIRLGVIDGQQTAIGAGLGLALNRLTVEDNQDGGESRDEGLDKTKPDEDRTKVIVLLTDGVHNAEGIDPDAIAEKAHDRGVIIYTVLMGRHSGVAGSVDPDQLDRLAGATKGKAYTAEDMAELQSSFQELLDKLDTSEIEGEKIRAELFMWLLWPVLALMTLDVVLRNTRLRRFP